MAVATGVAEAVVCYRAFNERSGFRFGGAGRQPGVTPLWMAPYAPFGFMTPAAWVALHAQRYMSTYGVTNARFRQDRRHRPQARREQPRRLVLRDADNH